MTAVTERVKVLLVDDQPANLVALEAMLAELPLECLRAESGTQALKRLLDHDVAVILLDVQMPGLDGFETAHLIRKREKSRHTPIIFVTAMSRNESNVFQGYSVGAVDYLFKPIVPEILKSKVQVFVELFRKNQKLERQTSELSRLSRQNELILNSAADGVIGVALDGSVTFVNPSASRMIGRTAARLVGVDLHAMLHPPGTEDLGARAACRLKTALCGDPTNELRDDTFYRFDLTPFPVEYIATPMLDDEEKHVGTVLTFRDVTERRAAAMAKENERRYREAEAANKAKDDFLATLSHELRTPMTAILGWNEVLALEDIDPETRKEAVEAIRASANAQKQLIDDMLDVSRIIMGKFSVDLRPQPLQAIVVGAVDTIRHQVEEKQISLGVAMEGRPVHVLSDPTRLRQVFWNLLTNSVKFTEPGGTIDVRLTVDGGAARVAIRDSGAGIDAETLPYIFDRLVQSDGGKMKGGLGLGLAIASHIVELHGGGIEARSDGIGQGAEFTVLLPVWSDQGQAAQHPSRTESSAREE
ncbi:MAG TPA: ATP-binding protein [Thermoanaerobaculia bacterium]